MKKTLENILREHSKGLVLINPPTGFGKTTAVINFIRRFLRGEERFSKIKRIFFVTNLLANLPYDELLEGLNEDEKGKCFRARATIDYVLDRFLDVEITDIEIKNSKECKDLKKEIESYHFLKTKLAEQTDEKDKAGIRNNIKILEQKIRDQTEKSFRKLIKNKFFYNKSVHDKKNFIRDNGWFRSLYPICEIEKYKVIFLTTKRFISKIDTFVRLPYYAYCDSITDSSLVFIDEFDATKQTVLDQIIDDGVKNTLDTVRLFLNLHFALQNVTVPKKLLRTSEYHQKKVESGPWYPTQWHFDHWRGEFERIYSSNSINYLIKTVDLNADKAFLFDDGKYINVIKDNAKKFIYAAVDNKEDILSLRSGIYDSNKRQINAILRDLEYCIDGLTNSIFYVANNYMYSKNEGKSHTDTKYTLEEALYTVLDVLNLDEEEKSYLFNKIQKGDLIFNKPDKDPEIRRGFNFTELEDSNYHDMKSVVHKFNFPTTPEDILIKLANRALIFGVSATARVKTCIGNYDIDYLDKKIDNGLISLNDADLSRIEEEFSAQQIKLSGQYTIHTHLIDDFSCFSDREKCVELIKKLFQDKFTEKYLKLLEDKTLSGYYYLNELKLALLYKEVGVKKIHSFIAFTNSFPREDGKFNLKRLQELFRDISELYSLEPINFEIVNSQNFDYKFEFIKELLATGKQVFVLTTYQTIGSGKNIQYLIPETLVDTVVVDPDDDRRTKDFEGIYLLTPTNLLQNLRYDSEDKYRDLANYLFQQEYLYQNRHLTYSQMRFNIANGFRRAFFSEYNSYYPKNGDLNSNTLKIANQAIGRICRCRNKNRNIYIYSDKAIVESIQTGYDKSQLPLINNEFKALLTLTIENNQVSDQLAKFSIQSKRAYVNIKKAAYTVRNSYSNNEQWKYVRDYVLKNPTTNNPDSTLKEFYFEFDEAYSGYSYKQNNKYDFEKIVMDTRHDLQQVSEAACDLPVILSIGYIAKMFDAQGYCKRFKQAQFIMCPSLFKQIYLGALGEVVGKCILEKELGWDLQELDDPSFYEYFDFKLGNSYFDFKHWDDFFIDNNTYVQKVERKLAKIKGAKCFVINLVKRSEAPCKINMGETVIQIPYLIDGEKGTLNDEAIEYIGELYDGF